MTADQDTLNEINAELMMLRALLLALVANHPSKQSVIQSFQREIAGLQATLPDGIDPEYVVELRARTQMYLSILAED